MFPGKWYDEVRVGDRFGTAVTVTETHLVLGSGLFGDFNPFPSALVSAPVGMYFSGTAIAYLEHACRFTAAVRPGDTLRTQWTVTQKLDKPKHKGGICVLAGTAHNQKGELAVEADGKILVSSRPSLPAGS